MKLQIHDSSGAVSLHPANFSSDRPGFTVRDLTPEEIAVIESPAGKLVVRDGVLLREDVTTFSPLAASVGTF